MAALAALALAGAALPAQVPVDPQRPQQPVSPTGQDPTTAPVAPPGLGDPFQQDPSDPDNLASRWYRPESFQGFPVFPPSLGGYGQYPPPPPGFAQPPEVGAEVPPPPLVAQAPNWPAWVLQKRPAELPYDVGTAVLVRHSDRVWLRAAGDDAFVPLYHWDTTRPLQVGADVRVQHTGCFQLLLYGGSRTLSLGPAELSIVELTEVGAKVAVRAFTRLEIDVYERGLSLQLPDGSELLVDPLPTDAAATASTGTARLFLDRAIEPGRYAGRATIFNAGDRPVRWKTALGEQQLDPGFRLTMFLAPPAAPMPAGLVEDGVSASADGARRSWTATADGSVSWSGARFRLQPGATLSIDPLLGDPFAVPPPAPNPATPAPTSPTRTAPEPDKKPQ